jgi:hypothetical protein
MVTGQLKDQLLYPRKRVLGYHGRLGDPYCHFGRDGEKKNHLPLSGIYQDT